VPTRFSNKGRVPVRNREPKGEGCLISGHDSDASAIFIPMGVRAARLHLLFPPRFRTAPALLCPLRLATAPTRISLISTGEHAISVSQNAFHHWYLAVVWRAIASRVSTTLKSISIIIPSCSSKSIRYLPLDSSHHRADTEHINPYTFDRHAPQATMEVISPFATPPRHSIQEPATPTQARDFARHTSFTPAGASTPTSSIRTDIPLLPTNNPVPPVPRHHEDPE
jgi:hypothetical protein